MIISCPECSGPFEVRDSDIAPLLKVACPSCKFEMILDFAAANDSSLLETGHQTANGWFTEAEYRQAAGGEMPAAQPAARATPTPKPTPAAKPAAKPVATPASKPTAKPAAAPKPTPAPPPAKPKVSAPPPEKRTMIASAAVPPPRKAQLVEEKTKKRPPPEARATVRDPVMPPPDAEAEVDVEAEAEGASPESMLGEALEEVGSPGDSMSDVGSEPIEVAPPKGPPHTPPGKAESTQPEEPEQPAGLQPSPSPAELSTSGTPSPDEKKKGGLGRALMFILIGLLLVVAALAALGYAESGDPNPLPVLDALLQEYVGVKLPI